MHHCLLDLAAELLIDAPPLHPSSCNKWSASYSTTVEKSPGEYPIESIGLWPGCPIYLRCHCSPHHASAAKLDAPPFSWYLYLHPLQKAFWPQTIPERQQSMPRCTSPDYKQLFGQMSQAIIPPHHKSISTSELPSTGALGSTLAAGLPPQIVSDRVPLPALLFNGVVEAL